MSAQKAPSLKDRQTEEVDGETIECWTMGSEPQEREKSTNPLHRRIHSPEIIELSDSSTCSEPPTEEPPRKRLRAEGTSHPTSLVEASRHEIKGLSNPEGSVLVGPLKQTNTLNSNLRQSKEPPSIPLDEPIRKDCRQHESSPKQTDSAIKDSLLTSVDPSKVPSHLAAKDLSTAKGSASHAKNRKRKASGSNATMNSFSRRGASKKKPSASRILSLCRYTGPLPSQRKPVEAYQLGPPDEELCFETIRVEEGKERRGMAARGELRRKKPRAQRKVRKLHKTRSTLQAIEYDPRVFIAEEGILVRNPNAQVNLKELVEPLNLPVPVPAPAAEPVDSPDPPEASSIEARTARRTDQAKNDEFADAYIRIGTRYQAVLPDREEAGSQPGEQEIYGDVLWDPQQAQAAEGGNYDSFITSDTHLNRRMLLIETLHRSDYCLEDAKRKCRELDHRHVNADIELDDEEAKTLRSQFQKKSKDFVRLSKETGFRKDKLLVHYYRWKGKNKGEYARVKESRKQESDYCEVCDDGGLLVVCDLCHKAYHLGCLKPPLTEPPKDDWFCQRCLQRSPARVNRIPVGRPLDTSPSVTLASVGKNLKKSSDLSAASRAALKSLHKEFSPKHPLNRAAPNPKSRTASKTKDSLRNRTDGHGRIVPDHPARQGINRGYPNPSTSSQKSASYTSNPVNMNPKPVGAAPFAINQNQIGSMSYYGSTAGNAQNLHGHPPPTANLERTNDLRAFTSERRLEGNDYYYRVHIPWTPEGLLIRIGTFDFNNVTCFIGYGKFKNGGKSPAELAEVFESVGDEIMDVDKTPCDKHPFEQVTTLLRRRYPDKNYKTILMRHTGGLPGNLLSQSNQSKPGTASISHKSATGERTSATPWQAQQVAERVMSTSSMGLSRHSGPEHNGHRQELDEAKPAGTDAHAPRPTSAVKNGGANPVSSGGLVETALSGGAATSIQNSLQAFASGNGIKDPASRQASALPNRASSDSSSALNSVNLTMALNRCCSTRKTGALDSPGTSLIPEQGEFHRFLASKGITTSESFLNASSVLLAAAWARHKNIDPDHARDFVGAMKFGILFNRHPPG